MTDTCYICCGVVPPRHRYCARCYGHIYKRLEEKARAIALKAAWDPIRKGFRCYYTDVILDENDLNSPWYLTFDHRTPGKKGDLVVCAAWVNLMKNRLSEQEFRAVIIELARCRAAGDMFDMAVAEFKYWKGSTRLGPKKHERLTDRKSPRTGECIICSSKTFPYSPYCPICRHIVQMYDNIKEHTAAMQAAWDPVRKAFFCCMTGLQLDLVNKDSPVYHAFDHQTPKETGTLRMVANFANVMKTALSEDEFWLVVKELAHHFQTQEAFNKDIIKFAYWKGWVKAQRRAMRASRPVARARGPG